ncbi:hypothetical protein [Mucilaginibacter flavidus]|uniref:hypothetical protein n=1 Tax=Mucilaginibacter flavidus TaxID=2949309 RepID=UPI002092156B|nr:hypothetical protein [Mucilaginibacter flavidus]MCO5950131.1 hypothetical protein [Mucilaginibacter flavidus]
MKNSCLTLLTIICIAVVACNHKGKKLVTPIVDTSEIHEVSLLNLIVAPEKYRGHKVRTFGYLNLEFEGNGIYLHKEDYENGLFKNALWVEMSPDSIRRPEIRQHIKSYVMLEGTFEEDEGHMDLFSGTIKNISRIIKWGNDAPTPKKEIIKFPPPRPTK